MTKNDMFIVQEEVGSIREEFRHRKLERNWSPNICKFVPIPYTMFVDTLYKRQILFIALDGENA